MSEAVAVLAIAGPWLAQFGDLAGIELVVILPDGQRRTLCAALGEVTAPDAPGAHAAPEPPAARGPPVPARVSPFAPPASPAPPLPFNLRPKHRAILAAASAEPLTRKALILRARIAYTPDARRCLGQLVRAGLLEAEGAGVRLPRP
jgi:hypothetical protein